MHSEASSYQFPIHLGIESIAVLLNFRTSLWSKQWGYSRYIVLYILFSWDWCSTDSVNHVSNFTAFYIPSSLPNISNKCNISYFRLDVLLLSSSLRKEKKSWWVDALGFTGALYKKKKERNYPVSLEERCCFCQIGIQVISGYCIIVGLQLPEHSRPSIGFTFHESLHTLCFFKWKIVFCMMPTGGLIREST